MKKQLLKLVYFFLRVVSLIYILNLIIIRIVLFTDTINFYFVIQNLRRTFK